MGVCVNDGDTEDGQGGQKGWSGWGPYAIVYGALAQPCGLVTLAEYSMVYTSTPGFCAAAGSNYKTLTGLEHPWNLRCDLLVRRRMRWPRGRRRQRV